MLLNNLQSPRQPPSAKHRLVQGVSSAKVEKPWTRQWWSGKKWPSAEPMLFCSIGGGESEGKARGWTFFSSSSAYARPEAKGGRVALKSWWLRPHMHLSSGLNEKNLNLYWNLYRQIPQFCRLFFSSTRKKEQHTWKKKLIQEISKPFPTVKDKFYPISCFVFWTMGIGVQNI